MSQLGIAINQMVGLAPEPRSTTPKGAWKSIFDTILAAPRHHHVERKCICCGLPESQVRHD
jgi:hypothetical protein